MNESVAPIPQGLISGNTRRRDLARNTLLAAIGFVPGAPVARLVIENLWGSAYNRRIETWIEMLLQRVLDVEDQVESIQAALESDEVAAVALVGLDGAVRAADDEKLYRLASALANVALNRKTWSGRVDHAQMLMRLLGELTSTEVSLLQLFGDPERWVSDHAQSFAVVPSANGRIDVAGVLAFAYPELATQEAVAYSAIASLEARGLLDVYGIAEPDASFSSEDQFREGCASVVGRELLDFFRAQQQNDMP